MGNFEKNISLEFDNFNNNNGESWIKSHRVETFEKFKSLGIPKLTDEDWRFTNLSDFSSKSYSLNVKTPNSFDQTLVPEILKDIDGYFIILVNGKLVEYSSDNLRQILSIFCRFLSLTSAYTDPSLVKKYTLCISTTNELLLINPTKDS